MILMRLLYRGSSRVREVPFPSPRVQRLHRPSILCNARLVFFIRCPMAGCSLDNEHFVSEAVTVFLPI